MNDLLVFRAAGKAVCRVWAIDLARGGVKRSSERDAFMTEIERIHGDTTSGSYVVRERLPMQASIDVDLFECAGADRTPV